jgi:tetratricopeptide (TPR) repeat protein
VREIGRALEVAALLEGSVQRQGDNVRIIAQLIDTVDGAHIWSSTFDDNMQNIFDLQDRIASEIMVQLQISISEQDRRRVLRNGTSHPEAYDLLMRANGSADDLDRRRFDSETDPKLALIDQALDIDPDYAQAWEARSARFSSALFFDSDPGKAREYITAAMDAANRAIEADPDYSGGYIRLASAYRRARNLVDSEKNLITALELDPASVDAMTNLGLLKVNDDPQMALDLFTRVRELDPQSTFVYRQLFFALDALGRMEEGLQTLLEGAERFPEESILLADIAGVYLMDLGRPDETARWASKIVARDSQDIYGLSTMSAAWLAAGDIERARQWLDLFDERFAGSPEVVLRQFSLDLLTGDAESARLIVESVPESPSFMFDRATPIGGACLVLGDAECLAKQASNMQRWLDQIEAMGQVYAPSERYERAAAILRNAAIANAADRDIAGMTALLEESADWPITGGRGTRHVGYLRVMLHSLLEDDAEAIRELNKTLDFADDGFLYRDIFRLPPDRNPLITRLSNAPGYADWMAALNGRRENTRGNLVRMEQNGEILSANDVAP